MREFRLGTVWPPGDCAVLRVAGEVGLYTAPALRARIRELAAEGAVHLIADLGPADSLDPTGAGVLAVGLKRLREDGGSLALAAAAPHVLRTLQITGLTKAITAWPTVADAVTADPHWRETAEGQAGSASEWCRRQGLS
jgi:anti-sigma B factor antagonist